MPTPVTQPRPHPQRRFSEYTAMVLAVDKIGVGLFSIIINSSVLHLCFLVYTQPICKSLRMDHVGGHLGASSNFQEMGEEGVAWGLRVRLD